VEGFILETPKAVKIFRHRNKDKQIHAQPVPPDLGLISGRMTGKPQVIPQPDRIGPVKRDFRNVWSAAELQAER
jgi:hypothetical protein